MLCQFKVLFKILCTDFAKYGALYADQLVEVIMLSVNRMNPLVYNDKFSYYFVAPCRAKLHVVEQIIDQVYEHKMARVYEQFANNKALSNFTKLGMVIKPDKKKLLPMF